MKLRWNQNIEVKEKEKEQEQIPGRLNTKNVFQNAEERDIPKIEIDKELIEIRSSKSRFKKVGY